MIVEKRSAQQEARKAALTKLSEKFDIPRVPAGGHCSSASEEDLYEYLHGGQWIDAWVAVTFGGEDGSHFFKTFSTRRGAEDWTIENVSDDLFVESPIAVVDLDDPVTPWGRIYRLTKLVAIYEGSEPREPC